MTMPGHLLVLLGLPASLWHPQYQMAGYRACRVATELPPRMFCLAIVGRMELELAGLGWLDCRRGERWETGYFCRRPS
jgi:hypothetical protein